jgi:hypothetical protein
MKYLNTLLVADYFLISHFEFDSNYKRNVALILLWCYRKYCNEKTDKSQLFYDIKKLTKKSKQSPKKISKKVN